MNPGRYGDNGPGDGKVRRVTPELRETARRLRRQMTPAETILWEALRGSQVDGHRFRRQHAVGTFVLDFYCPAARLVIEVDGGIHDDPDVSEHDALRQQGIENHGLRVLRFPNEEVISNLSEVVAKVRSVLAEALQKNDS